MNQVAASWFEPTEIVTDCRDAKDNGYLEPAQTSKAEVIVSGDDDLLSPDPRRSVRYGTPRA